MSPSPSKWFRRLPRPISVSVPTAACATGNVGRGEPSARKLLWFPHAGGGTAPLIRASRELSASVFHGDVWACVMPGREDRFSDEMPESMAELIGQLDREIPDDQPAPILIGHSLGALVAESLARRRSDRGFPPTGLIVMAMQSPDRFDPRPERLEISDEALAAELDADFGGIPPAIRNSDDAMGLFLPIIRADLRLFATYQPPRPGEPMLNIPVRALGGTGDRATDRGGMLGWRHVTRGSFSMRMLSGDHFFPIQHFARVLAIAQSL